MRSGERVLSTAAHRACVSVFQLKSPTPVKMSSPSGYSARASSSSSSSSTSSSTTPSSLWSSFTRASARTGFSPLALTASSFLAAAGGFALAWALLRERLLRRDAPRGEEGGNLSEVFRALREAHARRKKRREAAKNASNAASSSSASAATALSDDDVIIRAPTPADIDAITLQTHDAFNEWNASVGLPKEWPSMDFCKWVMSSCITEPTSFGLAAFHARTNECLGSVFNEECDIVDGAVGCGPWSAKWGALQQGVGRRLVEEIVAQSIRHGAKSIRLNQIAANLTSYSLYSSLGFVTREVYTVWCGAISTEASSEAIRAGEALGYTVRPMTESDVPACDALHQAALGISRKALLTKGVTAGDGFMPLTVVMDKNGEIM
jgi:predicted N-acetyltransferase YhbS